jgi:hypothetical protein
MANLNYTAAQIDALLAKADTAVQPETVGDLSELETTDKDSVVDAINELFTSVSDGKSALAAAITDKGVATAATDTFADMAQNIEDIPIGTSKNTQIASGVNRTANTSATAISGQTITVSKTGVYDVYWAGFRSSTSGTFSTQLYINGTAYGSTQSTWSNHGQAIHLSNVSLSQGDVLTIRAVSRGSSYYCYASNLTIVEV